MFHWTIHLEGEHRKDQAAVVVGHEIYCFGGDRNKRRDPIEVSVFNTVSLCWRMVTTTVTPGTGERHLEVPSRRRGHTAVLIEDTVYIWGGDKHPGYCNVLYAFDVDSHIWFKPRVSGPRPRRRSGHSACVLEKVMFIHGGWNKNMTWTDRFTNAIYKLDTSTMVWSGINTRVTPPSWDHSATIIGTKMFVFGGEGDHRVIRVFDTETHLCRNTPSRKLLPERRSHHSASAYNGELYIFGGCHHHHYLKDMWKFSPETFSWKKVEPKGKRPHGMKDMCCCMVGDRVFLFGGNRPGDLYVLDFSPSLKTLCKLAVIQYGLDQSELPHNIRWELAAMSSNDS